ncbi:MAG TPA: Hsp70 family protein [Candidatus Dormibacteraeota bacterium]|nr:Hsp70 family protein [Candidatus Dormibacteraeota bacterium]
MTSAQPLGYGIDFGTSNSSISVAYSDRVEVVPLGRSTVRTLPSFVYLHRGGRRAAGDEAVKTFLVSGHEKTDCWNCPLAPYGWDTDCRQYRKGGGCNDARLLSGVKHELAKLGFAGTNSWATDFSVGSLVSVVLARLKGEADAATGHEVDAVVLGHPVVFAGIDRENRTASEAEAFGRLEDAARAAGFKEIAFLPEPTAAVIEGHSEAGVEIAVDFGGGTFDVAVLDSRDGAARVAGTAGVAIGGEILDGVLFDTIIGPELGLDAMPSWLFNELRTASSVRLLMADPGIPNILARIGGTAAGVVEAILYRGLAYDFYQAIEAAKIALSSDDATTLAFAPLGLNVTIRRSAFESMIRPELDQVAQAITHALNNAGIGAKDVDRVLLTGGSAYIPAFRRDLATMFGEDRLEQRDAFTAVVHGLGVRAQQLWASAAVSQR